MSWGELYALLCTETGWTWEYVDEEMTLERLDGFTANWNRSPPVSSLGSILLAIFGAKPAKKGSRPEPPKIEHTAQAGEYLEAFGSLGFPVEDKRRVR
jgi:hypothetical protein